MPNRNPTNTFNPEIREYFLLNGFTEPTVPPLQGGLLFVKREGDQTISVQFWRDRIEMRGGFNFELQHSYLGFDGQDTFCMMWLVHFMGAIRLEDVKRAALAERIGNTLACAV